MTRYQPSLWLWAAAVATVPVILIDPGLPQVTHVLLGAAILIMATSYFAPVRIDRDLAFIAALWLGDVVVVNVVNWQATGGRDEKFLFTIAYYLFNAVVMFGTASLLATSDRAGALFRWGLLAALVLEVAIVATGQSAGMGGTSGHSSELAKAANVRTSGSFENPNQLGYFALLIASCWYALHARRPLSLLDCIVTLGALFLCVQSSSRAAILGALFLPTVAVLQYGVKSRAVPVAAAVVFAAGIIATATADVWLPNFWPSNRPSRGSMSKRSTIPLPAAATTGFGCIPAIPWSAPARGRSSASRYARKAVTMRSIHRSRPFFLATDSSASRCLAPCCGG